MSMRGIDTQVRKNRRRIFKEVASLAYESRNLKDDVEALPYKIVDYDEYLQGKGHCQREHPSGNGSFPASGGSAGACDTGT